MTYKCPPYLRNLRYLFRQEVDIGAILDEDGADSGVAVMSGNMQRSEAGSRLDIDRMVLLKQKISSSEGKGRKGGSDR